LRSGRERKDHTPSSGGAGAPGKGLTPEVREALSFEERWGVSEPTVPESAR
jgi:hypothetical protein